jgi:prevent-host-death family protein
MKVNVLEAKNRLSQLIKSAQAGEEVVIANRGAPVARLVPIEPPSTAGRGEPRALLAWLAKHPLPGHARRSAAEIDAAIAEEREAWD